MVSQTQEHPAIGEDRMEKIRKSIAYMEQHIHCSLQIATLAAVANLSPSHFASLFRRHTGCTPLVYFTRLRMQEARRLLEKNTLSIKEVAVQLGYNDPLYFSRVFKSVNEVSPSDYRQALKR